MIHALVQHAFNQQYLLSQPVLCPRESVGNKKGMVLVSLSSHSRGEKQTINK